MKSHPLPRSLSRWASRSPKAAHVADVGVGDLTSQVNVIHVGRSGLCGRIVLMMLLLVPAVVKQAISSKDAFEDVLLTATPAATIAGATSFANATVTTERFAYATLVNTPMMNGKQNVDFVFGALALARSLREVGSRHRMICMITSDVPASAQRLLREVGWEVLQVDSIINPHMHQSNFQPRLKWAFTKLQFYGLPFERVLYLDSDIIVTRNLDEIFYCGSFCVVMRDNRFNSGVQLVSPRNSTYNEFMSLYERGTTSYNAGEQGFSNALHPNMFAARRFRQGEHFAVTTGEARLPSIYNGDVAVFYLRDFDDWQGGDPVIIHYTMDTHKPWYWTEYTIWHLNWLWYAKLPIKTEPAIVTISRLLLPAAFAWTIAGLVSMIRHAEPSKTSPNEIIRLLTGFRRFSPAGYAHAWFQLNVFGLAWCCYAAFLATPGIPHLHPTSSLAVCAAWTLALARSLFLVQMMVHEIVSRMAQGRATNNGLDEADVNDGGEYMGGGLLPSVCMAVAALAIIWAHAGKGVTQVNLLCITGLMVLAVAAGAPDLFTITCSKPVNVSTASRSHWPRL